MTLAKDLELKCQKCFPTKGPVHFFQRASPNLEGVRGREPKGERVLLLPLPEAEISRINNVLTCVCMKPK